MYTYGYQIFVTNFSDEFVWPIIASFRIGVPSILFIHKMVNNTKFQVRIQIKLLRQTWLSRWLLHYSYIVFQCIEGTILIPDSMKWTSAQYKIETME